jgi:hypothetical protein
MKFKKRDRGRSLWVRDFTSHRHGVQGGALAKVLIEVHKMLIKVLIGREMSTLEKSRVSLQGAHPLQGAHLDLSTLGNPELRSTTLESANGVVHSAPTDIAHRWPASGATTLERDGHLSFFSGETPRCTRQFSLVGPLGRQQ